MSIKWLKGSYLLFEETTSRDFKERETLASFRERFRPALASGKYAQ